MHPLGIERLSVFGMPPVEFVELAGELGCQLVGIGLSPSGDFNPQGFPAWSLRDDPRLREEMRQALRDTGVRIGIVEGFAVVPGHDPRSFARDLDLVAELGAKRIAAVSLDKDLGRSIAGFAILAEMADARGLLMGIEMGSLGPIGQVEPALAACRGVGRDNFSLIIDAMHFFRLGNTIDDLRTIPPELIGYAQLCDAPWAPRFETYMEEAMYERMVPGAGELPLAEFVAALPEGIDISMEIPLRELALAGVGPHERLAPCVRAATDLLRAAG
jgi:sugar phosphate isomerase/epimerase